jgi:hypothetical protein
LVCRQPPYKLHTRINPHSSHSQGSRSPIMQLLLLLLPRLSLLLLVLGAERQPES